MESEKLRSDVTAANEEAEAALRAISDYKNTVTSLESELHSARDVERMHTEQVIDSVSLITDTLLFSVILVSSLSTVPDIGIFVMQLSLECPCL